MTPPPAPWLQALRHEFSLPAYDWRRPGGGPAAPGWLERFFDAIGRTLDRIFAPIGHWIAGVITRFVRWLLGHFHFGPAPAATAPPAHTVWLWILFAVLAAAIAALVWRRARRQAPPAPPAAPAAAIDLEQATGAERSADHWLRLSADLQAAGDYRLALRAAFLACLAALHDEHWLHLRRDRTNREYVLEFRRRLRQQAAAAQRGDTFANLVQIFDRAWYGGDPVTPAALDIFLTLQREVAAA